MLATRNSFGCSAILGALLFSGCGGGASGVQDGGAGVGLIPDALYVDPRSGRDEIGRGTETRPFATLTYALSLAGRQSFRSTVIALPGTYSASTGERFPLRVESTTTLVGSRFEAGGGVFPEVIGCGPVNGTNEPAALVIDSDASVAFLSLTCASGTGLYVPPSTTNANVRNILATKSRNGFLIAGKASVINSSAHFNSANGLFAAPNSQLSLSDNRFADNRVGINIQGGALVDAVNRTGTTGMSVQGNSDCGLRYAGSSDLKLFGTSWNKPDDQIVVVRRCVDGNDIAVEASGSIMIGAPIQSNAVAFRAPRRMQLLSPSHEALVGTRMPTLEWTPDGSRLAAVAVFARLPVIGDRGIENSEDIVWYWDTGRGGGASGRVPFGIGASPTSGSLAERGAAVPLDWGRSYYWIAWEWSTNTGAISASSTIGVFRTSPAPR